MEVVYKPTYVIQFYIDQFLMTVILTIVFLAFLWQKLKLEKGLLKWEKSSLLHIKCKLRTVKKFI